jgi:hypothetical protein
MQGLFVLEIYNLELNIRALFVAINWYFFVRILLWLPNISIFIVSRRWTFLKPIEAYDAFFFLLLMLSGVLYLGTIGKGFLSIYIPGRTDCFYSLYFNVPHSEL